MSKLRRCCVCLGIFLLVVACGDLNATREMSDATGGTKDNADSGQPEDGSGGSSGRPTDASVPAGPPVVSAVAPSTGPISGGTLVVVSGVGFLEGALVTFDGSPATDTTVRGATALTTRVPAHAEGKVTVAVVNPDGKSGRLADAFEYVRAANTEGSPRLVSAISTGNTGVRLTFSEPVEGGAADAANYSIVQANVNPESGALRVLEAVLEESKVTALLTTASQGEVTYRLSATNIRDLDGNPLASADRFTNPTEVTFAGTPADSLIDADGDGLSDSIEQSGWTVSVTLANGQTKHSTHTSDPSRADTDDDGLDDLTEFSLGTNPRSSDTDGDGIDDNAEYNVWYSEPTVQDTDEDGLTDGLELFFRTSPVLDDSDGDGVDDNAEITLFNRDPLIANLPLPQVVVTGFALEVDVRSIYTDENGSTQSFSSSESREFAQTRSQSNTRSDTRSTEAANTSSQQFGVEVTYEDKGFSGTVSSEIGFEQSNARGYSATIDQQTASEAQEAYQASVEQALETSERREVTRTVEGARIRASVNLANNSDIPFTISNLQLSVLQQDRAGDNAFRPIATLVPAAGLDTAYNLGPFDPERGPIIFDDSNVFPNLVDALLREPIGVIFKVANFDVQDEQGRNFAYSSSVVKSRTAGITFDFGNGQVENYRVATHSQFDDSGRPVGITIARALQIIGLTAAEDDGPLPAQPSSATRNSYGTKVDSAGVERLVRIRTVQNDLSPGGNPEKRFWAIQSNNTRVDPNASFSTINLRAGDEYLLFFTRDLDRDGLHEREEMLYGSLDNNTDTDRDGMLDFAEVRVGWTVSPLPGLPYRVFSSPAEGDADQDGLSDPEEFEERTDPNRRDTDADGLSDRDELRFQQFVYLFDNDADDSNNPLLVIPPYSDAVISDGGDGRCDTVASGDDVQLHPFGVLAPGFVGDVVIYPGLNGRIDTIPGGDDRLGFIENLAVGVNARCETQASGDDVQAMPFNQFANSNVAVCVRPGLNGRIDSAPLRDDFIRVAHESLYATHPTRRDTDFDGIPDGREILIGTNPNSADQDVVTDSDNDGLFDSEEDAGWYVDGILVRPNKQLADTDRDGLPDVYEWAIGSNPVLRDTDGDSLLDGQEYDPDDTENYYSDVAVATAATRCAAVSACVAPTAPPLASRLRTNVVSRDSDADGLTDDFEVAANLANSTLWPVRVTGSAEYQGRPVAYLRDTDADGWTDGEEFAELTDPAEPDTDDDGTADPDEHAVVGPGGLTRLPLRPDQLIVVTLNGLIVNNNCGDLDGRAEWDGNMYIDPPGFAQRSTAAVFGCRECCNGVTGPNGTGTCNIVNAVGGPATKTFFLLQNQTFFVSSDTFYEVNYPRDTALQTPAGGFSLALSYPATPTVATEAFIGGQGNCSQSLSVSYTITVQ